MVRSLDIFFVAYMLMDLYLGPRRLQALSSFSENHSILQPTKAALIPMLA